MPFSRLIMLAVSVTEYLKMAYVRMYLKEDFFSAENWKEAGELYKSEIGEEGFGLVHCNASVETLEFEDGVFNVDLDLKNGSSIVVDFELSDDVLAEVLQHAVKKLNRLRTALESLR